jgi:hypothetical protein
MYEVDPALFDADRLNPVTEDRIRVHGTYGLRYLGYSKGKPHPVELPIFVTGKQEQLISGWAVHARTFNRRRDLVSLVVRIWNGAVDSADVSYASGTQRRLLTEDAQAYLVSDPNLQVFSDEQLRIMRLDLGLTHVVQKPEDYIPKPL